ncbi:MAG TPA: FAD-linked oxidase C-terminal domain-containing protein [Candidatus Dormibacteraeota bacterium]|nr:FAD-linked oxidase C-terminal domain-containing protein [Candidatus Dormibacteraeota bacterium]
MTVPPLRPLEEALRAAAGPAAVLTAPAAVRAYACDGLTGTRVVPRAVVLPSSTDEVAACVRACAERNVPFVARGAGTGLSGGALPVADGVVIGLARMTRVLSVDVAAERVVVQPGVTNAAVTEAVAADGYFYAPDPSSQSVCTIGGNVAENSGGAHCLGRGFTVHHVTGLTLVTPQGRVARVGGACADAPGSELLAAIVGSEGTLGIVTEVTLRVLRQPERIVTLLAAFGSMHQAGEAVSAIIAAGVLPAAVELMDELALEAVERAVDAGYPQCPAVLLAEVDGSAVEAEAAAAGVEAICRARGALEVRRAATAAERARMWRGRRAAFAAMGRISPSYYVQDGVVPRTSLPAVLDGIRALEGELGVRVANVFHAGDGNLHPLVLYDASVPGDAARAAECAGRILDLCVAAGGSITGEHGVGTDKACSMPKMFDAASLTVMGRLRDAFDPAGLCNPGKALPTPRLCGEVPGVYRPHWAERAGLAERL